MKPTASAIRTGRSLLTMLTLSLGVSACVSPPLDLRPAARFFDHAPTENRPVTRPVRAITSFSESLACMDRILDDLDVGTTLITSKNIADPTSRASVATKEMVITTLSQMSRVSNAFRYVDYEVDIVRQDTVQNLTGLLLNANQIQLQKPALYISGAISYVDQGVLRNGEQAGSSASRLELGYSADWNATLIGLEMHLGDFQTRTLVPGIDSANDIVFGSRGQGLDAAARISRYGVQFNLSRSTSMGAGAAVRTLVELALIEVIGKWARIPYWQCLMLDRTNPAFERQFKDWFDALNKVEPGTPLGISSPNRQVLYTKRALTAAGYYEGELDEKITSTFKTGLARYQSDQGLIPSGELTFDTFQKLFQDYVKVDENGTLQQVGWDQIEPVKPALSVKLELANQKFIPGQFNPNERIYMTSTVNREAYLYCFYQDVRGRVSRLFPNPFQRDSALPGNRRLRIPDWLVLNPGFSLRAGGPGVERASCYASEKDIFEQLPEIVQNTAILPMAGVESLDAIDKAMQSLAKDTEIATSAIQWKIIQPPAKISRAPQQAPAATQTAVAQAGKAGGTLKVANPKQQRGKIVTADHKNQQHDFVAQRALLKFPDAPAGFYRILEGENLQAITIKTNVPLQELQKLNDIKDPNLVLTGRLIKLSPASALPERETESKPAGPDKVSPAPKKTLRPVTQRLTPDTQPLAYLQTSGLEEGFIEEIVYNAFNGRLF